MLGKKNIFKRSNGSVNWPLTILLMGLAIFTIFGPLYMTLMIAVKDPSQMASNFSLE
jgi:raffinose/stachyose/melibiose transport system permease protein